MAWTFGLPRGAAEWRIAARTLARSRGFAVVAIVSLGLAIGLNTTIYSLLDALIDPVGGVRRADEPYHIRYFGDVHHRLPRGAIEGALASGLHGYQGVTGDQRLVPADRRATIERGDRAETVDPLIVRSNFFSLLGTRAVDGRVFAPSDEALGTPVAVISDRLAAELFPDGVSPIGATIMVEGQSYGVIGTVHRYEPFPSLDADCWLLATGASAGRVPISIIRLYEHVSPADVNNELRVLAARLAIAAGESSFPPTNGDGRKPGVQFIDMTADLCNAERCWASEGGMVMYRDDNHLTRTFAETLQPELERVLGAIVRGR